MKNWYEFNASVRIPLNYMEALPLILIPAPVAAIYFPKPALAMIIVSLIATLVIAFASSQDYNSMIFKVLRPLGVFVRLLCIVLNIIFGFISSVEVMKNGSAMLKIENDYIARISKV